MAGSGEFKRGRFTVAVTWNTPSAEALDETARYIAEKIHDDWRKARAQRTDHETVQRPTCVEVEHLVLRWQEEGWRGAKQVDAKLAQRYGLSVQHASQLRREAGFHVVYPGGPLVKRGGTDLAERS